MRTPNDLPAEAENRFCCLLNQQGEPFRQRVKERFIRLRTWTAGVPGESVAEFNEVLAGGAFPLAILPEIAIAPAIAKEAAAILCQISLESGYVQDPKDQGLQHLGWNNLNLDAKNWCKGLLLAQAPDAATTDELRDLLAAKSFAAILVDHLLRPTPRNVAEMDKGKVTGPGENIDG